MSARYYFHLLNGSAAIRDVHGVDLDDVLVALVEAYETLEEIRNEQPSACAGWEGWRLEMVDTSGRAVHTISLDAFDPARTTPS